MHADENAVSYFGAWDGMHVGNFLLDVRASVGIVPRFLVRSQPPCQPRAISLSTVYAKLHNQFPPFLRTVRTARQQQSGLSVKRFEPREQTRSCINDAALLRDRSLSRVIPHLGKMQECGTQSLYRVKV
jgi:hypothetical protein